MSLDVVATSDQLPASLDGDGNLRVGFGPGASLTVNAAATQYDSYSWPGGIMASGAASTQIDMAEFDSIVFAMAITAGATPALTLEGWDGAAVDNVTGTPTWIGLIDVPAYVVGSTVTIRGQASLLGCRYLRFATRSDSNAVVKATFYARR